MSITVGSSVRGPPLNELFRLSVQVFDKYGQPLSDSDVQLQVDADMPEHRHGMNTSPEVVANNGVFEVSGMLFHMPGYWELYFDVTNDGLTERAQSSMELD